MIDLTGPISLETAKYHYYRYRVIFYLLQHPNADPEKAYKYARVAWSRKLNKRGLKEQSNDH